MGISLSNPFAPTGELKADQLGEI